MVSNGLYISRRVKKTIKFIIVMQVFLKMLHNKLLECSKSSNNI